MSVEFRVLLRQLKRQERLYCTVWAINELLLEKRVYDIAEFDAHFCENAVAKIKRAKKRRKQ